MIFLNSASSAAAPVFYLPGMCTHTDTEGKERKVRVRNILKFWEKTQYLMNTLYQTDTRHWTGKVKDTSSQKYPFLFSTNKNKLKLCNSWNGKALKASSWSFYYNRKNMETKEVVLVKAFQKMLVCFLFSFHNFIFV